MAALLGGVTVSLFFCSGVREYLVVLLDGKVVGGPFATVAEGRSGQGAREELLKSGATNAS
jgi:hypothetical protein